MHIYMHSYNFAERLSELMYMHTKLLLQISYVNNVADQYGKYSISPLRKVVDQLGEET